ncbi:thioesterase II family protein [Actinocrispum wychmicini]|nr:alpha/beta fold hydrolase [Actinocrispum wychmicini]
MDSVARVICFPHAGGSASYYFRMSRALAPEVEVLAVQYPGRQDRHAEQMIDSIPELTGRIVDALGEYDDRPFAFFGHSMGALVAYEVARTLQGRGGTLPRCLFVSGRQAPSVPHRGKTHATDDAGLLEELRRIGGTDPRFLDEPDLAAAIVRVTRNDYRAVDRYRWAPGPPLECPVTALTGANDPQAAVDEVAVWREFTSVGFDLRVFPGGHFYLDACRAGVAGAVSDALCMNTVAVTEGSSL